VKVPLHILIVDDNRDAADSLGELVRMLGHQVTVAYDGEAGLRAATRAPPDCLILDIAMPGMDGYTLARKVREAGLTGAKLMAVTAFSDAEHARRADEAGFDYRLVKPADPAEITRALSMIEHIRRLAEHTEDLARRNVSLAERTDAVAARTETLAGEAKELLREVKDELKDVKQDMREIKDELREVKDKVDKQSDGEDWKTPPGG
jgi:two-component system OmpR family response regulator